jgi:hypothetical protein
MSGWVCLGPNDIEHLATTDKDHSDIVGRSPA